MKEIKISINGKTQNVSLTTHQYDIIKRMIGGEKATFLKSGKFVWKKTPNEAVNIKMFKTAIERIANEFQLTEEQKFKYMNRFLG